MIQEPLEARRGDNTGFIVLSIAAKLILVLGHKLGVTSYREAENLGDDAGNALIAGHESDDSRL